MHLFTEALSEILHSANGAEERQVYNSSEWKAFRQSVMNPSRTKYGQTSATNDWKHLFFLNTRTPVKATRMRSALGGHTRTDMTCHGCQTGNTPDTKRLMLVSWGANVNKTRHLIQQSNRDQTVYFSSVENNSVAQLFVCSPPLPFNTSLTFLWTDGQTFCLSCKLFK